MPTFDTPSPIQIRIDGSGGSLRVRATDRSDTVVTVRAQQPAQLRRRPGRRADTGRVRRRDGSSSRRRVVLGLLFFGTGPSVDLDLLVPEGSGLEAALTAGDVDCEGRLGDVRIDNRYGDIRIDRAATLRARTSAGDVTVGAGRRGRRGRHLLRGDPGPRGGRPAAAGQRLRRHHRGARARLGRRVHQVRPGERPPAVRGSLDLATSYGKVETGIAEGVPAWLDLESSSGKVRNLLTPSDAPGGSDEPLRIRARTSFGDIVVRRA